MMKMSSTLSSSGSNNGSHDSPPWHSPSLSPSKEGLARAPATRQCVFLFVLAACLLLLALKQQTNTLLFYGHALAHLHSSVQSSILSTLSDTAEIRFPLDDSLEPHYRSLLPKINFPPVNYSQPRVVLCTSINGEEKYVSEWLDYHLALGFSEIYISDNSPTHSLNAWNGTRNQRVFVYSTPNQQSTMLRNLTEEEQKHPWWHTNQNNACADVLRRQTPAPKWVAFFDCDEFLVLYNHSSVVEFAQHHVPNGSIQINWRMYGTSQHSKYLDFPVTLRFQYREDAISMATKMLVSLEDLKVMQIHTGRLKQNERRHFGVGPIHNLCCVDNSTGITAALHHYSTKSLEEIQQRFLCRTPESCKKLKGRPVFDGPLKDDRAWKTLINNLPQYKALEGFYEKALKEAYHNQTEDYQRAYDTLMQDWNS